MKFSAIAIALFATLAIAAPAAEPAAEASVLEKRQYCGQCSDGFRICCTGASGICYGSTCA
ncbi:hypothetical protein AJ80_06677 [Polytolypa hystricis UAMH7299]|uniref:Invertebrate defensins family profile domain-containing protein n=1 Tax=Polytolypa hystricis (strain UAMH7299) TaxID=1447883 RepID=A0A2B7XVN2_POLH7|nr:hypothetical protein AJ80_06677 [Polytolypa hystricis UAMH7299]